MAEEKVTINGLIGKAFSTTFNNFVPLIILVTLANIPGLIIGAFTQFGFDPGKISPQESIQLSLGLGAISLILIPLAAAFTTQGIYMKISGKDIDLGKSLSVGISCIVPVLIAGVIVGIFTILGWLLFIIPGIIIMCRYYVVTPIIVVEKKGVGEALKRSVELTDGYKRTIFNAVLGVGILCVIITVIAQTGITSAGLVTEKAFGQFTIQVLSPAGWVIQQIVGMVVGTVLAVLPVLIYYELRNTKEHTNIEEIISVFD